MKRTARYERLTNEQQALGVQEIPKIPRNVRGKRIAAVREGHTLFPTSFVAVLVPIIVFVCHGRR